MASSDVMLTLISLIVRFTTPTQNFISHSPYRTYFFNFQEKQNLIANVTQSTALAKHNYVTIRNLN